MSETPMESLTRNIQKWQAAGRRIVRINLNSEVFSPGHTEIGGVPVHYGVEYTDPATTWEMQLADVVLGYQPMLEVRE